MPELLKSKFGFNAVTSNGAFSPKSSKSLYVLIRYCEEYSFKESTTECIKVLDFKISISLSTILLSPKTSKASKTEF